MKKMTASMAAALVLGVLVAPAAEATTDPVYDPGSKVGSKFTLRAGLPGGGETLAWGTFVEYSVSFSDRSYVKDLADDGHDVYLWVQYGKVGSYSYKEQIGSASGLNVSKSVTWSSPAGMYVDDVSMRVCLGPGEDNCSKW
ncbi:hypothetical protein ABZ345_34540 [Lentzea sp. NPDC005914]|uniref:hypothetical protein n=1 Tax=Lentzea sp. NPDC005914 TaxID=3154572 RepID=UPI0033E24C15